MSSPVGGWRARLPHECPGDYRTLLRHMKEGNLCAGPSTRQALLDFPLKIDKSCVANTWQIDLHEIGHNSGLQGAVSAAKHHVVSIAFYEMSKRTMLITGKGIHSMSGFSVIKHNVLAFLDRYSFSYRVDSDNPGIIYVYF